MNIERRRIIYGVSSSWEPLYIDGYVQNGLVFHLDGIETGSNDTHTWIDLIGGTKFNLTSGCEKVFESNTGYVNFRGTQWSYARADKTCLDNLDLSNCTIEAVYVVRNYYSSSYRHVPVFFAGYAYDNLQNHIGLMTQSYTANNFNFAPSSNSSKRWILGPDTIDKFGIMQVSLSNTIGNINGLDASPTGNTMSRGHNRDFATVGAMLTYNERSRQWSDMDFLNGKVYSIRVYNRCLTQSEINQNRQTDTTRFGLGGSGGR